MHMQTTAKRIALDWFGGGRISELNIPNEQLTAEFAACLGATSLVCSGSSRGGVGFRKFGVVQISNKHFLERLFAEVDEFVRVRVGWILRRVVKRPGADQFGAGGH